MTGSLFCYFFESSVYRVILKVQYIGLLWKIKLTGYNVGWFWGNFYSNFRFFFFGLLLLFLS